MDLTDPLKPEVLRPIITLVVPGTIAVGPYVLVLGEYLPGVANFWTVHPTAFTVLLVMVVLAAGFVIDDISSFIESEVWDRWLDNKVPRGEHKKNWDAYLKLELDDQLIGQRYLRTRLTQMKFELAMAVALPIFWSGLLWLQLLHSMWSRSGFIVVSVALLGGAALFLWTSWESAKLLSSTRKRILEAFEGNGPKGIKRKE